MLETPAWALGPLPLRLGIISDTHNLVRPEALRALSGVQAILHAGDVCRLEVLQALEALAPVVAVRGNCDQGPWAAALPRARTLEVAGRKLHVRHDLEGLSLDPVASGLSVVITGHSHQPEAYRVGPVLYLNPGSAGPRRFHLPISLACLTLTEDDVEVTFFRLDAPPA